MLALGTPGLTTYGVGVECGVKEETDAIVEFAFWLPLPHFLISEVWDTLLSGGVWRVAMSSGRW